mgnify:CR=1 FL=1
MAEPTFSICVYCGSRPGENPAFAQAAQEVGRWIGEHSGQLVYGGGRSGLMGTVAEATRLAGGRADDLLSTLCLATTAPIAARVRFVTVAAPPSGRSAAGRSPGPP